MSVSPVSAEGFWDSPQLESLRLHVVQQGEHIEDIATQHGVEPADILAANPVVRNPEMIYPGQNLQIPVQGVQTFGPMDRIPDRSGPAAPTDAQQRQSAINVLNRDFGVFDTAGHGGDPDGKISQDDLKAVANGSQYTPEQKAAAKYLLDHKGFNAAVDTAGEGGSTDGIISRKDVKAATKFFAAPNDASQRQNALNVLNRNFGVFDTAGHGGDPDGKISQDDLKTVANGSQYTPEERAAAKYLLKHSDFNAAIDTAGHGGSTDGIISRDDVQAALKQVALFANTSTFITADPTVSYRYGDPRPAGDDPRSAAIRTEADRNDGYRHDVGPNGTFTTEVRKHKNDPAWLQSYFRALGAKQTAEYLSAMTDPVVNSQVSESQAKQIIADERTALQNMYASGVLNDSDIARLVEGWAKQSGDPRSAFAQLFAGMKGAQAQSIKNAFAQACAQLSLTGDPGVKLDGARFTFTADAGKWLSDGDRNQLAAAAAFVLSTTSAANQVGQLQQLQQEGGKTAIKQFFAQAMAVDTKTYGLTALTTDGAQHSGQSPYVSYAGVVGLLKSLANAGAGQVPVALKTNVFSAVSEALTNGVVFNNYRDNANFKDALSTLFMHNSQAILHKAAPDGAFSDPSFIEGMTKFFEIALFTAHPGADRNALMKSVLATMSKVGDASAKPPSPQKAYEAAHGGWSQEDHVEVMGGLQAMILQAASNQKSYLKSAILKDQQQRQAMIGFITGMAFAFVPGGSEVLSGLAAKGGEKSNWLSKIPSTIAGFTFDQTTSQMEGASEKALLNLLAADGSKEDQLADVDQFIESFKNTILETSAALPNGEKGELDLRTKFESAFAYYKDLVDFP